VKTVSFVLEQVLRGFRASFNDTKHQECKLPESFIQNPRIFFLQSFSMGFMAF
jgi:hypothetical protein